MKLKLIIGLSILLSAYMHNYIEVDNKIVVQVLPLKNSLPTFSITNATAIEFDNAKSNYNDKLIQDTLVIKKQGDSTEIPLNRTEFPLSIIFKDTLVGIGETEESEYRYLGSFSDYYLVSGSFWENYECYLINKVTGNKITTWNRPFLSSKSTYFANLSMTYGLEGVPNGIQIWKIDSLNQNYIYKYIELDQQIWTPNDFVWETDNSLLIMVYSIDKFWALKGELSPNDYYYLRLKL